MRIIQLTPGTGSFYCGSCMRDNALVMALRKQGHDALMVPLYLDPILDEPSADEGAPLLFGGINQVMFLFVLGVIAFLFPNTQEWVGFTARERDRRLSPIGARLAALFPSWRPGVAHGALLGVMLCYCLLAIFAETPSEFLYFQF